MNKVQRMQRREGGSREFEKPTASFSSAIEDGLERGIKRVDRMFLLICQARAAYIRSLAKCREKDYVESHGARKLGTEKLYELEKMLTGTVDKKND